MKTQSRGKSLLKKLFSGSGWALFTMFVWELVEEGLETLIAYALSSAVAIFLTKALSTLTIITATQGIKVSIKKFLIPFIRELTYKEGNDKLELLKKYWQKVWGNKITGTLFAIPFTATAYFALNDIITKLWLLIITLVIIFIIAYNIAVFLGGETLAQIQERLSQTKLTKEEQAKQKAINEKVKELSTKLQNEQIEKLRAEATAIIEEETKSPQV